MEIRAGEVFPPVARGSTGYLALRIFSALVFLEYSFGDLGCLGWGGEFFLENTLKGYESYRWVHHRRVQGWGVIFRHSRVGGMVLSICLRSP